MLTLGYTPKHNFGINPAVSQNLRKPFHQYDTGATPKVDCST